MTKVQIDHRTHKTLSVPWSTETPRKSLKMGCLRPRNRYKKQQIVIWGVASFGAGSAAAVSAKKAYLGFPQNEKTSICCFLCLFLGHRQPCFNDLQRVSVDQGTDSVFDVFCCICTLVTDSDVSTTYGAFLVTMTGDEISFSKKPENGVLRIRVSNSEHLQDATPLHLRAVHPQILCI